MVGLDGPDLRTRAGAPRARELLAKLSGAEVRRLSFAVVLEVADRGKALAALVRAPGVQWVEEVAC